MQKEIQESSKLLNEQGELIQRGWAKDMLLDYHRGSIKAAAFKIKEWDYYAILSDEQGISFTISDLGYIGFVAATVFDFISGEEISNSITTILPLGSFNMPESSKNGDVKFSQKNLSLRFSIKDQTRTLEVHWKDFQPGKDLKGSIVMTQPSDDDSMLIATPFAENPKAFYYNHKINCMPAQGSFTLGERKVEFADQSAFGVLDWGRGVWTYSNTWYWGSASGMVDGRRFGLNIGYGFGDTSAASENIVFLDGRGHKLDEVSFHIPENDFLKPWQFSSNDGRLELDFVPILDRYSNTNLLVVQSWQHQVFGHFSGKATLDDGTVLQIENLLGFAEKVKNRW
ncbi:MAG: DUF2804 domain-containing protein [Candidatus Marinimicrobia bacterium]|jgi:hypothetical protein|nr:DUF2804 domain-containing protein [Candidatus Neomarinimicrobiota bacterium]MBT3576487.1 DUF2804 domain-containing protein [Candidatus Neomarinimicrobiota bacterium]MBT3681273.1 DUF2804 domain-containing protein [Candidatus Neomarinimicrobiota bacterium]MBT4253879.1 DUF2804 domain-containing protein [Candidatus Neomarinimicrobiota bacterium]MBT5235021.1 DUF2804 domain-containing protein [Candidatus Neomarinimicrobiota bacterium]